MKISLLLGSVIVAALAVAYALPGRRSASRKAIIKAPSEKVFEKVTNIADQSWRSNVSEVRVVDSTAGREVWVEKPKKGPDMRFRTKAKMPAKRFDIEIIDNPRFGGHWVGTFVARPDGQTEIEFTEEVVVAGLMPKLLSYAFFNIEESVETYIADLKKALE